MAIPTAFAAGVALFVALASWRRSNMPTRFVARVWIIGGGAMTWGVVMRLLGGSCVFSGPVRGGGYDSTATSGRDIVLFALVAGLLGAVIGPLITRARNLNIEW